MRRLIVPAIAASLGLWAQSSGGGIQGTIIGAGNKPLPGAFVTATAAGLPPVSKTIQSANDGTFQIQGLPAGTYSICVQVPGGGYIDPCQFGGAIKPLTLTAGQQSNGTVLKLQTGSVLKIHLNDTSGLLAQQTKQGRNPDLLLGVFGGPQRTFYPAHQVGADKSGSDYQLTVPLDMPMTLVISSKSLKLADASGTALPSNASQQAFQHATGDSNPKAFVFTVTGVNP
jgi:hypothetical protein